MTVIFKITVSPRLSLFINLLVAPCSARFDRVIGAKRDNIILCQQCFQSIIGHAIVVPVKLNYVKHIGQMNLGLAFCLSFVQVNHNPVRFSPRDRITFDFATVNIFSNRKSCNRTVCRICNTIRHIDQFYSNCVFITREFFSADRMVILIGHRDINQGITFFSSKI